MKQTVWIFLIALMLFSCINDKQKENYEINGIAKNIPDSTVVFISANNINIDSTIVLNEEFRLTGKVEGPTNVYLIIEGWKDYKSFWLENNTISFEAEKGKFKDAKISGSETQKENDLLSERLETIQDEIEYLETLYHDSLAASVKDSLFSLFKLTEKKEVVVYQGFVKEFPNSLVSAHVLKVYATTWGKDKTEELFDQFSIKNKESENGKNIAKYIELNKEPKIGEQFVDFEMTDKNGEIKKLSDLNGKIVLLEFWASWCGPCRQENPNLVKTYEKYNPKGFEIFAVSLDLDKESWLKAIENDKLNWEHVSELNGSQNKASLIYGVNGIPDNFLIDEDGVIVGRSLRGEKLNEKLMELMK